MLMYSCGATSDSKSTKIHIVSCRTNVDEVPLCPDAAENCHKNLV